MKCVVTVRNTTPPISPCSTCSNLAFGVTPEMFQDGSRSTSVAATMLALLLVRRRRHRRSLGGREGILQPRSLLCSRSQRRADVLSSEPPRHQVVIKSLSSLAVCSGRLALCTKYKLQARAGIYLDVIGFAAWQAKKNRNHSWLRDTGDAHDFALRSQLWSRRCRGSDCLGSC